jgi:hypothetical protein
LNLLQIETIDLGFGQDACLTRQLNVSFAVSLSTESEVNPLFFLNYAIQIDLDLLPVARVAHKHGWLCEIATDAVFEAEEVHQFLSAESTLGDLEPHHDREVEAFAVSASGHYGNQHALVSFETQVVNYFVSKHSIELRYCFFVIA